MLEANVKIQVADNNVEITIVMKITWKKVSDGMWEWQEESCIK